MLTTTGLPRSCAYSTARHTWSEPTAEPPGLLTRNRIARTLESSAARRMARATDGPDSALENGLSFSDEVTAPSPNTTATFRLDDSASPLWRSRYLRSDRPT